MPLGRRELAHELDRGLSTSLSQVPDETFCIACVGGWIGPTSHPANPLATKTLIVMPATRQSAARAGHNHGQIINEEASRGLRQLPLRRRNAGRATSSVRPDRWPSARREAGRCAAQFRGDLRASDDRGPDARLKRIVAARRKKSPLNSIPGPRHEFAVAPAFRRKQSLANLRDPSLSRHPVPRRPPLVEPAA